MVAEKVHEEVSTSKHPSEAAESTSLADLTSSTSLTAYCPLANAVISEALRLHPPVPLEIHENVTGEAIALPDGTVVFPGEKVVWSPWVMSRSKRIWGKDAGTFRPERWLWNPEVKGSPLPKDHPARKTAFEFPVFHAGPRSCLGKQLARIELVFALRELMLRFDISPAWKGARMRRRDLAATGRESKSQAIEDEFYSGTSLEIGDGLTGPIKGGLPVKVRKR